MSEHGYETRTCTPHPSGPVFDGCAGLYAGLCRTKRPDADRRADAGTEPSDVAGVVEQTWQDAAQQIRTVVDSVVFPALSMILAVAFFGKVAL